MKHTGRATSLALTALLLSSAAVWAGPKVVSGPGANAECFKPWSDKTKFFQWDKQPGPYKIALVNGFVGNTWRIQMVKTAKAFAEQPGIKENIKEFKVVSTGTDVAAQLGAMEDFINQGYDAIVVDALAPEGYDRVIRLADKNNVVIVPFDNILDSDKVMMKTFTAYALPMTVLIDPQGNVVAKAEGPADWGSPEAVAYFKRITGT